MKNGKLKKKDVNVICPERILTGQNLHIRWSVPTATECSIVVDTGYQKKTYGKFENYGHVRLRHIKDYPGQIDILFYAKNDNDEIQRHFIVEVVKDTGMREEPDKNEDKSAYSGEHPFFKFVYAAIIIGGIGSIIVDSTGILKHQKEPTDSTMIEQIDEPPSQKPTVVSEFDVEAEKYRSYNGTNKMDFVGTEVLHVIVYSDNHSTANGMVVYRAHRSFGMKCDFYCSDGNCYFYMLTTDLLR